jgi:hypothetical protein
MSSKVAGTLTSRPGLKMSASSGAVGHLPVRSTVILFSHTKLFVSTRTY